MAHYRKIHPYPPTEQSWATPGNLGLQCVETEFGKVALAICYDIHFLPREYDELEPWLLLFPTAWVADEHPAVWFLQEMPAKAKQHGFHIVVSNWSVRRQRQWRGYGFSEVIRSDGRVLSAARSLVGSEIIFADLPTAFAEATDGDAKAIDRSGPNAAQ